MRCPTLADLPPPPPGKTGWPWIVESEQLPDTMPDGAPWPCISIVTPSFNHGHFIEETIRSVLLQGHPNLEYMIIDGASVDETIEIIKKYEQWLSFWRSEPDGGQSSAINYGLFNASGVIANWLNSDDYLGINSLRTIGIAFGFHPEAGLYTGGRIIIDEAGATLSMQMQWETKWREYMCGIPDFPQEATFFKLSLFKKVQGLKDELHFSMDVVFFGGLYARQL